MDREKIPTPSQDRELVVRTASDGRVEHELQRGIFIGVWMCPPDAAIRMVRLIRSGLLPLDQFETTCFDLEHANDAVAYPAATAAPFKLTVIRP